MWPRPRKRFQVRRNNVPLDQYPISGGVNVNITYSEDFSSWEAATAAGCDMWKWEIGEYPSWFRAKVIIWHKYHTLIKTHTEDAVSRASKRN